MDGYVTIGTELNTKEFDAQMRHIETKMLDIEDKLKQADMGFEVGDTEKLEAEYERLGNQLLGLKEKQEKYNQSIREAQMAGFNKIKESVDSVGNSLQKVTKRIVKMAVAVFGIRSAFMFVRRSIDMISQGDKQLSDDIEYMKIALAYTIEPIVRGIVNLAKQLMFYIAYIVKAWTGRNIFENANKGLANANKQAKALSKQLAGFDEMNVLSDSGKGDGAISPSFDLSAPENIDAPAWIKWIASNGPTVIAILAGITGGLLALKFGLQGIQALGIGIVITGILLLIQDVIKFIDDPSWQGFANILGDIAIIIGGIMLLMGNWWGLLVVIAGLVVKLIADNWDTIAGILGTIGGWIWDNVLMPVLKFVGGTLETIWSIIKTLFSLIQGIFTTLINIFISPFRILWETVSGVFNGIKDIVQGVFKVIKGIFTGDFETVMEGFKQIFKGAFNTLWSIAKAPLNLIIDGLNALIKGANKIKFDVPNWVPVIGGKKLGFNLKTIPRLAKGTILNNPGKGVPVAGGRAIAGEAGPEAYLPLSDTQLLEQLGSTIGKYVRIDNVIDINMDSRKINRILQSSADRTNFAMNR